MTSNLDQTTTDQTTTDQMLLAQMVSAAQTAGGALLARFSRQSRIRTPEELQLALQTNDEVSLSILQPLLTAARPQAGWVKEEMETGLLPVGEWWMLDPVEGNINHIHGLPEWCLTITLIRDNRAVLTVVHVPLSGDTYAAQQGGGATLNGQPLSTSQKTDFSIAMVSTGQSEPFESEATRQRMGESISAMTGEWRVLRASVPTSFHLMQVAAGHTDVFWEYSQVRSGLMPGLLLVTEAGGLVTDTHGNPWTPESPDFLAAAPGVHGWAVQVLSGIGSLA
ncbi:inositol monophosphatase family protein [Deinococcus roseus]|uniref:Inositol phosphatase n=1 Tax=Deinococcus roseus TaxID=392414 RepID=A0ABQ2D293_9DEIO|nr:inositol monophosphatase [Deinococcus roseus]GGJ36546.1 inositol phosphatase [Deinococcus roseus]